ncbi:MAG: helix-turn-helix transcriptional regulator [Gaiellaceae bacterium]
MHEFLTTTLARTTLATVGTFAHGEGWRGDPDEEAFPRPAAIFTTRGRWRFQGAFGAVDADTRVVVLGHAHEHYRCAHDEKRPSDRATHVTLDQEALGYDPLPARAATGRSTRLDGMLAELTCASEPLHVDAAVFGLLRALRDEPDERVRRGDAPVAAAKELLDASLDRNVTLIELARHVHVSPFHLHRLFRDAVGLPPHEYLTRRRIDRARELLAAGATVTETAAATGYSSPGYFSTAFRRRVGVTPSRYRDDGAEPRTGATPPRR